MKSFASESPFDALKLLQDFLEDFFTVLIERLDENQNQPNFSKQNPQILKEELIEKQGDSSYLRLERELQKYEQKVREQIRIEQQLKLHTEMLQHKLEQTIRSRENIEETMRMKIEVKKEKKKFLRGNFFQGGNLF